MGKSMPSPDAALKDFFKNNDVFAGLFNGYFFNDEGVINPDELEPENTAYTESIQLNIENKVETINKYRDNVRRTSIGQLVILGIEDQSKIHYSMPVRNGLYDFLGYSTELKEKSKNQNMEGWTADEWLARAKKGTKVTPIITVVFYTGNKPWDGPRTLHDMMDIDEKVKSYVPDYPLYVIDIGHDKDLSFRNKELNELKETLSSVYSGRDSEKIVDKSIIALTGILTGDEDMYTFAVESSEEKLPLCDALKERYARYEKKAREEAREEYEGKLAAKDAEIAVLKKQLAAARS